MPKFVLLFTSFLKPHCLFDVGLLTIRLCLRQRKPFMKCQKTLSSAVFWSIRKENVMCTTNPYKSGEYQLPRS
jgi:hypothetical protein